MIFDYRILKIVSNDQLKKSFISSFFVNFLLILEFAIRRFFPVVPSEFKNQFLSKIGLDYKTPDSDLDFFFLIFKKQRMPK